MKLAWGLLVGASVLPASVEFNRDIRPILSDKCFVCHGPDAAARKVPFRLDGEAAAKADLGGRFAIVPGDPARSQLILRITADKPALRMPPVYTGAGLEPREIDLLRRWVAEGARWEAHWSFLPPKQAPLPEVKQRDWPRNAVDYFVLARLEHEGLKPSAEAPRAALIRRASLDVTGLPPTPEEVDAFLRDTAPGSYERLLDRLFASPRYGERMAARWLDAARYADTNGYQTDAERSMWRWRDWVIDAFNRNMPFDRFAIEQIAGDLLPHATLEQKIATGFNRNHRGNSEGGIVPEEYLAEYAMDRVETASTVFLGLTLGCARCHNHKYDPFTQKEYYQLFAYFNNIPELGRYLKYGNTPPYIQAPTAGQQARIRRLEEELAAAEGRFAAMRPAVEEQQRMWERNLPSAVDWAPGHKLSVHLPLDRTARFDGRRIVEAGDQGGFGFYSKFTVAAWIRADGANGAIVTRAEDKPDGEGWGLYLEDGKLQVNLVKRRLDDAIRVETRERVEPGRWRFVSMSYDGSRVATGVRIWIDGRPCELDVLVDAINQDFRVREPLRIGGGGGPGPRFRGFIGDVRIYSRVLSEEEIGVLALARPLGEIAALPAARRSAAEAAKLRTAFLESFAPEEARSAWRAVRDAREARDRYVETVPTVMVMEELPEPRDTFVLIRGAYDRPGEKVARGVPKALPPLPPGAPDNRLGLARWLAGKDNPLTARVAVNRFWQMFFGAGLVKTVEDFGSQGEAPSHPELLDWLAAEFMRTGWDIKGIQKTILLSAAYRQSSVVTAEMAARDPENRLLARGPRLRLPAEILRDQALLASGLLVEKLGGPSVRPYQPAGLWSELGGSDYVPDKGEGLYRRSLYTFWKRTAPPPFMAAFDSALRESCTVRESRTNTPLQALTLMNDVTFVEAARALAARAIRESEAGAARRLERAFRLVLGRRPAAGELDRLGRALAFYRDHFHSRRADAEKLISLGETPRPTEIEATELAAYTAVASLILNLDETLNKE
ncbi:MAG: DUF1553 domain-containing protein [Bryobacterales bacterium]|nr:DUF1553 domain-containing protein [Bryobacterales bacterium]